jgi:uncharacterized protein YecE (DUF72 family)
MPIWIGTSGYSYPDWVGPVYARGTPAGQFLTEYAARFNACEINFTYYRMPTAKQMDSMVRRSFGRVLFTVKAPGTLTHERGPAVPADSLALREALRPLSDPARLGAVLLQFPYSFGRSDENTRYLKDALNRLAGLPLVVEFRQARWVCEDTFALLKQAGAGFCCVDEPPLKGLVPPLAVVTSPVAYLRFHGRNSAKWFRHDDPAERYDYLYSDAELSEWLPRIEQMASRARDLFVFMNNHRGGNAVVNAERLVEILRGAGLA